MKIDWFDSEKYVFNDESVKRKITDSISQYLTDSDLESRSQHISSVFKVTKNVDFLKITIIEDFSLIFKIRNSRFVENIFP